MVGELHGVRVLRLLKVLVGVAADVAPAADVPADQADPQVLQHRDTSGGAALGGCSTPRQRHPLQSHPQEGAVFGFPLLSWKAKEKEGAPCASKAVTPCMGWINPTQMGESGLEGSQQALEGTDWKGHHHQAGLAPC